MVLIGGDNSEVFLEILLLQVLLGQVLEVSLAESDGGLHNNVLRIFCYSYCTAQVASLARDLYASFQEVFEIVKDDDVVLNWKFAVDLEL